MNDEAKKTRNEYFRKWRAEHKEQVKKYNKDYWEKKSQKQKQK